MKKITKSPLLCCFTLLGSAFSADSQEIFEETVFDRLSGGANFVELGAMYEYSDNIFKVTNSEKTSGNERAIFAALGYHAERPHNQITLNYRGSVSDYSEEGLKDESYWQGRANITQQIYGENLVIDLSHLRHRYLVDQNLVELPNNQGNRDVLAATPIWRIPYADRAVIEMGYSYKRADFSESDLQNSDRNQGYLQWSYAIDDHTAINLYGQYEKAKFTHFDISYTQVNSHAKLTGLILGGAYLVSAGSSKIDFESTDDSESGVNYEVGYLYTNRKNQLEFNAKRILTDSSVGLEIYQPEFGESNYSLTQLLWIDSATLAYRFEIPETTLYNRVILFWSKHEPIASALQSRPLETINQSGISDQLTWRLSERFSSTLQLLYRDSDLYGGSNKKQWLARLSGKYKFNEHLNMTLSASYRDHENNQLHFNYRETRVAARIAYRF